MINVFGDSHAAFLRGEDKIITYSEYPPQLNLPYIKSNFISSFTAYNLIAKISDFKELLTRELQKDDILAFIFGEVDIRNHIAKHILEFKTQYGENHPDLDYNVFYSLQKVVQRYLCFLEIMKLCFPDNDILVISPPAQCEEDCRYGTYDTMEMRNKLTRDFCGFMEKELALRKNMFFLNIFNKCLIPGTLKTDTSLFLEDGLHLKSSFSLTFIELFKELIANINKGE